MASMRRMKFCGFSSSERSWRGSRTIKRALNAFMALNSVSARSILYRTHHNYG